MKGKTRVLVVDDDAGTCETLSDILLETTCQVTMARDGFEAIEKMKGESFDVVLMDIKMPGINGVETYKEMKKINPEAKVVMMTAYVGDDLVAEALKEGASTVLYKPLDIGKMIDIIKGKST
ncbi:MAG: response regulator [Candidatus Hydrothermarchaeales archaeon]